MGIIASDLVSPASQAGFRWADYYEARQPYSLKGFRGNTGWQTPYLREILFCSQGGRVMETGIGTGHCSIWLARKGCQVTSMDNDPNILGRAMAFAEEMGVVLEPKLANAFDPEAYDRRWQVIFHGGLVEHFEDEEIAALVHLQRCHADWVIVALPTTSYFARYPGNRFGDERELSPEAWTIRFRRWGLERTTYFGLGQIMFVLKGIPVGRENGRKR